MAESHTGHAPATGDIAALRELKRAEANVREMREEAEKAADKIVDDAVSKARDVRSQADDQARAEYEAHLEKARQQANVKAQGIISEGQAQADRIGDKASGADFEASVDRVMNEFRRRTGAQ